MVLEPEPIPVSDAGAEGRAVQSVPKESEKQAVEVPAEIELRPIPEIPPEVGEREPAVVETETPGRLLSRHARHDSAGDDQTTRADIRSYKNYKPAPAPLSSSRPGPPARPAVPPASPAEPRRQQQAKPAERPQVTQEFKPAAPRLRSASPAGSKGCVSKSGRSYPGTDRDEEEDEDKRAKKSKKGRRKKAKKDEPARIIKLPEILAEETEEEPDLTDLATTVYRQSD